MTRHIAKAAIVLVLSVSAALCGAIDAGAAASSSLLEPPTKVLASAGEASALVSWAAPTSTGSSPITGYSLAVSPPCPACTGLKTSGATQTTVRGLSDLTRYRFSVTVITAASAATSSPSSAVIPAANTLGSGMSLVAQRYTLTMQRNGDLVERWEGEVVFTTRTTGHAGAYAVESSNGLLEVVTASGGKAMTLWPAWPPNFAPAALSGSPTLSLLDTGQLSDAWTTLRARGILILPASSTAIDVAASGGYAASNDAGDPTGVSYQGTYYMFSTGSWLGPNIQVLESTSPTSGYHPYLGGGASALPDAPKWEVQNTQTSPSVIYYGGHWLMFYDAYRITPHFSWGDGQVCLSVATETTLTPMDPQFVDNSKGPLECEASYGGSLDPSATIDPATGVAYLIWKTNDGSKVMASHLFVAQLDAAGTGFAGAPHDIWYNNTVLAPWETTTDDPDMVFADGQWVVLFSVGSWQSWGYGEAYIVCSSPVGPCTQPDTTGPFLSQAWGAPPGGLGPGGGSLMYDPTQGWFLFYEAWGGGSRYCTSYSCGATRRLYVAPIDLGV